MYSEYSWLQFADAYFGWVSQVSESTQPIPKSSLLLYHYYEMKLASKMCLWVQQWQDYGGHTPNAFRPGLKPTL